MEGWPTGRLPVTCVLDIVEHAPIPTWFHVGGGADRLARPASIDGVRACIDADPRARILGDGANLLVDDRGVGELVVDLSALSEVRVDPRSATARAQAGARLPALILETIRAGLGGLEGLGGIPASIGGAAVMNAGGAFGEIGAAVQRVHALDRQGRSLVIEGELVGFDYRHSRLGGLIVTEVEFRLRPGDPLALRSRLLEVMEYKKQSQPLAADSAGCVFRNPTLEQDIDGIGPAGRRVSAGLLLDRAGCKGLAVGGAAVSTTHANFVVTRPGGAAADVRGLMAEMARRVADRFGVVLTPEVVVWERNP